MDLSVKQLAAIGIAVAVAVILIALVTSDWFKNLIKGKIEDQINEIDEIDSDTSMKYQPKDFTIIHG